MGHILHTAYYNKTSSRCVLGYSTLHDSSISLPLIPITRVLLVAKQHTYMFFLVVCQDLVHGEIEPWEPHGCVHHRILAE
jgi:hypothetical protein